MRKQITPVLLVVGFAILLCGGITYFYGNQNPLIRLGKTGSSILTRDNALEIEEYLSGILLEEYPDKCDEIDSEILNMNQYCHALIMDQSGKKYYIDTTGYVYIPTPEEVEVIKESYDYSLERCLELISQRDYSRKCILSALSYPAYVQQIHEQANKMLQFDIFTNKGVSNILKTDRDFYGRENIQVIATTGAGFTRLFQSHVGVLCALSVAVVIALLMSARLRRENGGLSETAHRGTMFPLIILGFFGIFAMEIVASNLSWKLESFEIPIQSLQQFRNSCFLLNLGGLLSISVIFKVIGCTIVFFLMEGLFSMEKVWKAVAIGVTMILICAVLYLQDMPVSPLSMFRAEQVLGVYGNVNLFGIAVTPVVILVGMTIGLLILSYLFAKRQMEKAFLSQKEKAEKAYFEEINNKYNETRMIRHDMNNHLATISYLLNQGKAEEALKFVNEISEQLEVSKPFARTGRDTLDALLSNKAAAGRNAGVRICMDLDTDLRESVLTDYELCSLFGNLLDNAIEATSKCATAKREVRVKVRRQMDMLCVFVENPYDTLQRSNSGTGFATMKKDKKNHGLGLKQVERIIGKYRGNLSIRTENNVFAVAVLLNDCPEK